MTPGSTPKWRYALYGAVTVLAIGVYLWMGVDSTPVPVSTGKPHSEEELPALNSLGNETEAQERRDLFSFVKFAGQQAAAVAPPQAVSAPEAHAEEAAPPPDLLANLKVIGIVRRTDEVSVLLQIDTKLRTVALGEHFGAGDALSVAAIEGRNVQIVDRVAKTSRTFVLSEE